MRYRLLLAPLIAAAAACSSQSPTSHEAVAVPLDAIALGDDSVQNPVQDWRLYGGLERRERLVIDNQADWSRLWSRMNANLGIQPPPELPSVDFDRYMVIVASMGTRPTGGYFIEVEGVHRSGSDLYVTVHESSPGPRCGVTTAITTPTTALLVPRTAGRVFFVERRSVHPCE